MKQSEIIQKLRKEMEKALKPGRFDHSLGVAYTSAAMAMAHGADVQKALIAGLLHDCAKNLPEEEQLKLLKKHHIEISSAEAANHALLHAKAGAWLARHRYDIDDTEILDAIRYHINGRPGMSTLEKIVYVADFIEPNRKPLDCMEQIRREAFTDLDAAVYHTADAVMGYLATQDRPVDPAGEETPEYYARVMEDRRDTDV